MSTYPDLPTTMRVAVLSGHRGPEVLHVHTDIPVASLLPTKS